MAATAIAARRQVLMLMHAKGARVVPAMLALLIGGSIAAERTSAQTDLDALMLKVVAKRDENWRKLQQYVLDEREAVELRGPNRLTIWGERRDYTWYIRDGFFVRSPLKVNGAVVGEADRRKAEAEYLKRQ